ncbi:AraC family transcriptional regulator [[Pseudomonas] boreopolis]|uniref:AraC family transcriptional regulator n=1 Tax=Xanthomonas boreopolis TaxID=86183 RepID=UPI003DA0F93E
MPHASLPRALYESRVRPLSGVAVDYPDGHQVPAHVHPRAQLVYAVKGLMVVSTPRERWLVPSNRAVWLPPGTEHAIRMRGAVHMRSLFVNADAAPGLPQHACVIAVAPLLRELIQAAALLPPMYDVSGRDGRLAALLLDELGKGPSLPLRLPWPEDPRIARVCERLQAEPDDARGTAEWAHALSMSEKTFQRHFRRHTGLSFARWRQQARLLGALERLAAGDPVGTVAMRQGYESQSAFAAAFRRQFGASPSRFFD